MILIAKKVLKKLFSKERAFENSYNIENIYCGNSYYIQIPTMLSSRFYYDPCKCVCESV